MTKTIIFAIVLSAGLVASGFGVEQVFGEGFVKYDGVEGESTAQAIPDWVNNNFKWYGEGLIEPKN